MKVLLVCDAYCYKQDDCYYVKEFTLILLRRYLSVFEKVRLAVRTRTIEDFNKDILSNYLPLTYSQVEIYPIPFFQGPKQYLKKYTHIRKSMRRVICGCSLAILRLPSTIAFAAWNEIRKTKIPCVAEIVFDCLDAAKSDVSLLEKALWFSMHKKQQRVCSYSVGIACVTENYLQRHYFSKKENAITSSYSSIELPDKFYYKVRSYPEKERFRIIHVANQVMYNGRKGHKELIQVLQILQQKKYKVEIVFIGKNYRKGIEKLEQYAKMLEVSENISFTGYLSTEKLREQLIMSDIAVLPTKAEGLPRVIIEAMAVGLPCITTNVSGNPELISHDFLVDYEDVGTIAAKIIKLIEDKQLYENESKINFEKSRKYASEILNKKRTEFFRRVRELVEK